MEMIYMSVVMCLAKSPDICDTHSLYLEHTTIQVCIEQGWERSQLFLRDGFKIVSFACASDGMEDPV